MSHLQHEPTSQNLYQVSKLHSFYDDPTHQTLQLGSRVNSLQGDPLSQTLHRWWHDPWLGHQASAGWAPSVEMSEFL